MAATIWAPSNTRNWWAGDQADLDIHIEMYEGDIAGSFRAQSIFRAEGLVVEKNVANQTNTWRGDRIGGSQVRGRASGEALVSQRTVNDKVMITVEIVTYIRHAFDRNDDWTAPDLRSEVALENGSAHAKSFDEAHIIQLIKAGTWKAPQHLKDSGAFYDGITVEIAGYSATTNLEAKADLIVQAHASLITTLTKRDLQMLGGEFVTLVTPEVFQVLLNHNKLINVDFSSAATGMNDFSMFKVGYMNGIRVISTPRFPETALTEHHLGSNFLISAEEARTLMILFHPRQTLVTVNAQPMTVEVWPHQEHFNTIMDSFVMYNVGIRRGDACAVVRADA